MGKSREKREGMRRTGSFPSPSSSSSSSDFEFTVSLSPSSRRSSNHLCPADELFYKGQLLPLHLSPRISMVRTLLLASSSTSSSSTDTTTTTTASRDSNGSSSSSASSAAADLLLLLPECDSSRPSSVTEEEARRAISSSSAAKRGKYFSSLANRLSSVFLNRGGSKKDASGAPAAMELDYQVPAPLPTGKRVNATAKQVIKKYVKKVKPLYEKFSSSSSQKNHNSQNQNQKKKTFSFSIRREKDMTLMSNCSVVESMKKLDEEEESELDHGAAGSSSSSTSTRGIFAQSHSFSGNLRYPRRKRCAGSCPSSMRSSPTHSGLLRINNGSRPGVDSPSLVSSSSSMEELQNAIQGAIAHCKSTISQSNLKNAPSAAGATTSSDHDHRLDLCGRSLNVTSVH